MDKSLLDRLTILAAAVFVVGTLYLFGPKPAPVPVAQPSVPSLIPPPCDGRCSRPTVPRPFKVVCPYCRNQLLATPPETGEVGTVVGELPAKAGK